MKLRYEDPGMRFVRQPERSSDDEGLIPLINVIFLILIFFMIAGHMEAAAPFRVDPPVSRTDDTQPLPEELTLLLAADGRIAVGDQLLSLDTLEPWLGRRAQTATGASPGSPPQVVAVKADGEVQARALRSLLNSLRRAGFRKVTLLTDRDR